MNLKELAFPIRIYWDLTPGSDNASLNYEGICDDVIAMKFFTLNLLDAGSKLSNACIAILEKLKNEMMSVSLTVSPSVMNSSTIELLSDLKVNELLVEAASDDELRLISETVQQYKDLNMTIGASFPVNKDNYGRIPDRVSFCLNNDIKRIVFPMQRLKAKEDCFYISRSEGEALSKKLSEMKIDDIKITIHDPFLWRIFYPAVSFPGGGCQAANSMVSISPEGDVYPCPSMPVSLGNLQKSDLKTILSSEDKKDVMKRIRQAPEECSGCEELSGCMGGCTGRSLVLTGSMSLIDPACK